MEKIPDHIQNSLQEFILHLADTNLILSHRLSELCGHGPELEQDIAVTNIALDLLGQAQFYYQVISQFPHETRNEDQLAFLRLENEYYSLLLAEQPNKNFGHVVVRQFLYDTYHLLLLESLRNIPFKPVREIAEKALPEVKYHKNWSKQWVITLGDGTDESREIITEAFKELWLYSMEFSRPAPYQIDLENAYFFRLLLEQIREDFLKEVTEVLEEAQLFEVLEFVQKSESQNMYQYGGKIGVHTENMGYILSEIQYMQRLYPNCEW